MLAMLHQISQLKNYCLKVSDNRQFYPAQSTLKNLQVFKDLGPKKMQEYNDLFLEFKMYAR